MRMVTIDTAAVVINAPRGRIGFISVQIICLQKSLAFSIRKEPEPG